MISNLQVAHLFYLLLSFPNWCHFTITGYILFFIIPNTEIWPVIFFHSDYYDIETNVNRFLMSHKPFTVHPVSLACVCRCVVIYLSTCLHICKSRQLLFSLFNLISTSFSFIPVSINLHAHNSIYSHFRCIAKLPIQAVILSLFHLENILHNKFDDKTMRMLSHTNIDLEANIKIYEYHLELK